MRFSQLIILINIIVCANTGTGVSGQTFELYKSDTINRTDATNKKQGHWIYFYQNSKLVESEGIYENNRKTGVWKSYYQNGVLKSEITYKNNVANGNAKLYYEDGNISEEGLWKGTMWVGSYSFYHVNGQKAYEWNFDENGKRTGVQKYYYENGKLYVKGDWKDGKEDGTVTVYNEDGTIKAEKKFNGGQIDEEASKFYNGKKVIVTDIPSDTNATINKVENTQVENTNNNENVNQAFNGNGYHKLFNAFKKVDREGDFRNGQLINGKRYYYDADGKLVKTVIYENGTATKTIKEK